MYDSELFANGKKALENGRGVRQLLAALPAGAEISVQLDKRIPCTLVRREGDAENGVELKPEAASNADLELVLFSESIRRLSDASPDDLLALLRELGSLAVGGHLKVRLLSPLNTLYTKGYLESLKAYGPEVQRELQKYAFLLVGEATRAFETIKSFLKR